jgi:hypothetical protein
MIKLTIPLQFGCTAENRSSDKSMYYKVYYNNEAEYVTVVEMDISDENDYTQENFFKKEDGSTQFQNRCDAIEWMFKYVKEEFIDPSFKNTVAFNQKKFMKE